MKKLNDQYNLMNMVKSIISKYQDEMTNYARLNNDAKFEKLGERELIKVNRMNKFIAFKSKLEKEIEDYIYEKFIEKA